MRGSNPRAVPCLPVFRTGPLILLGNPAYMAQRGGVEPPQAFLPGYRLPTGPIPVLATLHIWRRKEVPTPMALLPPTAFETGVGAVRHHPACWCARRDLNSHVFRRQGLSLMRIPIPPLAHFLLFSSFGSHFLVPAEGLEPSILAATGLKPDVYTNSTTQAYGWPRSDLHRSTLCSVH